MAKTIKIPYGGKTYTLEYTRESVKKKERQGFKIKDLSDMPMATVTELFSGAFFAHHPEVTEKTKDNIFVSLKNRSLLIQVLAEMYADTYSTLFDDGTADDENFGWEVVE